ncbi:hypothetical protein DFH08DRAFT_958997 [Mycena albidolilacea]|uniref:Uncharacterized protein n=1 Tax=Mycena albidolilacea TaxID=1033008 RepID=A0AAD7A6S0_9AGAR|nr:hypothetical protein DFH08DRAFT_958997 [Mycena albidolilacea]
MPPPGQPRCRPPYWAEKGHEDPFAFCAKGNKLYVVSNGTLEGIFSSESRARKQVEGVSRGRWRKAKTWDAAILLWNESCDAFHDDGCPSPKPSPPPKLKPSPKPNPSPQSEPANRPTTFYMEDQHSRSTAFPISAFEAGLRMSWLSASSAPVSSAPLPGPSTPPRSCPHRRSQTTGQFSASTPKRQTPREPPHSPLAMMDAVEAFSRMGVDNPSAETLPAKQWAIAGVNKFFAARIDAIDHILTVHLRQADLMGSRNVKKLRAFIRGVEYVPEPGDIELPDD